MRVLGIDPGTRVMGFGVVEGGSPSSGGGVLKYVKGGEIKVDPTAPLSERLLKVSEGLEEVISEFAPKAVSVETVFYAKNVKSAIVMGHVRGVALLRAASSGLSVFEYSPTTIKQAVVGHGTATKEQVQKMVKLLLRTDSLLGPDASDALAAAICHINHLGLLFRAVER